MRLSIDLETFSDVDIKKAGAHAYVRSPNFEIMLCSYAFNDGPVHIIDFTDANFKECMDGLFVFLNHPDIEKCAYNAAFEILCLGRHYGVDLPLEQWSCTMHHGLYLGYPAGLSAIGEAMGLPQNKRKLSTGSALIRKFCVPRKPTKNDPRTRILPHHEPEKWKLFRGYNMQDVETERAIKNLLDAYPVPQSEKALWALDLRINMAGVAVDTELVEGALYCSDYITKELLTEAVELTGLENPKSVQQLTKWLEAETGEEVDNLQKATVSEMIGTLEDGKAKRMLELRQELSKTSVKKYTAMQSAKCEDGRIRGLLQFYGANRTGRWAGRLVQVQNLPRNHMDLDLLALARELVKKKDVEMLKLIFGNVPDTLSQLIRTAFVPAQGNKLMVSDFSAIEARVIAWLADEKWRLDVFATHGKIYEASASAMFGVPLEKITKGNPEYELRQKGKIAELALGYQGSVGALISMGADKMGLDEAEMRDIVERWRASNRRIVEMWYACENAALNCMTVGSPQIAARCRFEYKDGFLMIELPSGRKLYYPGARINQNEFGKMALAYKGIDQKTKKWTEISSYGGKLTENIVQAIARDCLAVSLMRVANAGYQTVMHIHDEIVVDCGMDKELKEITDLMAEPIPWAEGLILRGDGFESAFYKKD